MKKLIVLLLALTVVGIAAFAQAAAPAAAPAPALVWGGYIDWGVTYDKTGSNDATLSGNSYADSTIGTAIFQPYFDFYGKYDADTWGMVFRFRENKTTVAGLGNDTNFSFNRGYGWFYLFDKKVELSAGKFGHGTYQTGGNEEFGDWYRTNGMALDVMPIDGLKFGVMFPVDYSGATASAVSKLFWAGADYTMKDMFEVTFAYENQQTSGGSTFDFVPQSSLASLYVNVLAVPNLTAYVEAQMANIGSTNIGASTENNGPGDADACTTLYEYASYNMAAATFGLAVEEKMFESSTLGSFLDFDAFGSYAFGTTTVGADIYYASDSQISKSGYGIAPYVQYTVSKNSSFKLGLEYYGGDVAAHTYGVPGTMAQYTPITNTTTNIFADFIFQF